MTKLGTVQGIQGSSRRSVGGCRCTCSTAAMLQVLDRNRGMPWCQKSRGSGSGIPGRSQLSGHLHDITAHQPPHVQVTRQQDDEGPAAYMWIPAAAEQGQTSAGSWEAAAQEQELTGKVNTSDVMVGQEAACSRRSAEQLHQRGKQCCSRDSRHEASAAAMGSAVSRWETWGLTPDRSPEASHRCWAQGWRCAQHAPRSAAALLSRNTWAAASKW